MKKSNIRMNKVIENWPKKIRSDFSEYIESKEIFGVEKSNEKKNLIWANIIIILSDFLNISSKRGDKFLNDVLWAQSCLILAYRIKDDLYDSSLKNNSLSVASDLFLIESVQTYSRYFDQDSAFWDNYFNAIKGSIVSAIKIDELQQNWETKPQDLLKLYYGILSIFNIGIFALFSRCEDQLNLSHVIKICNEIMIVNQIMDDLSDIEEDFYEGRYNYVLINLTNQFSKDGSNKNNLNNLNLNKLILEVGFTKLFNKMIDKIEESILQLDKLKIDALSELAMNYKKNIISLKKLFHKNRVNTLFMEFTM